MKKCNRCKIRKPLSDFYRNVDRKDGLLEVCKTCSKKRNKKLYPNRKDKIIEQTKKRRIFLHNEIKKLKNKPCKDCGITYPEYCMEFDHTKNNKFMSVSKMIHEGYALDTILKEIQKTDLVCVLCHKLRTHKRLIRSKTPRIVRNFEYVMNIKNASVCSICEKSYHHSQMEFDHLANKEYDISRMVSSRYSIKSIQKEINKCQILCALCHRIKTFKDGGYII